MLGPRAGAAPLPAPSPAVQPSGHALGASHLARVPRERSQRPRWVG